MIDTDRPSLPDSPAAPTGTQELPDADGADGRNNAPEKTDHSAFEDTLGFPAWDGERASEPLPSADVPAPMAGGPPAEHKDEADAAREDAETSEGKPMSLMGHLSELRIRLTRILIVVILGFFACYAVSDALFGELAKPLVASMPQGSKLIFTSLPEAFFVYMTVAFVASLFLTSPYTFYQIWAFVAPGLYKEERRNIVPLAFFSAFFFLAGAAFCYFMVFPIAFPFFMSFATDDIQPMLSLDAYLSFTLKLLIAFGFIFEMPLFAFFLARMGVLTAAPLRRWRKYAILSSVIIGALLTPPDVPSQLMMASAILVLYEASIWIVAIVQRKPRAPEPQQKAAEAPATTEDSPPAQETT